MHFIHVAALGQGTGIELPRAIGEFDLTIVNRAGNGEDRQRGAYTHAVDKRIHRIVKIIILLRVEFLEIGYHDTLTVGCTRKREAGIRPANIAYQKHLFAPKRHQ